MQKNVASQKLIVFAFDSTTNLPKTGDAANITAYVSIDYGTVTVLGDTSATEMDATNAKGYYLFDLTQGETNGNTLLFSAKSSTANIVVIGAPASVQTVPASFAVAPGSAGAIFIGGSNAATTVNFTGNLSGSVGSVTNPVMTTATVESGTAQAGGTTSITLRAGASATNGLYDPSLVRITSGTGAGQARIILDYVGATKVATVDRDWRVNPDNTSVYEIIANSNLISTNEGLAQAGAASTITLNSGASAVNNAYVGDTVVIRAGTGQDQARVVTSYVGATKVATIDTAWVTVPDSTSVYIMWPLGRSLPSASDWKVQLTESYRANGAAPTPEQAVCEILGHLGEMAISGTTKTMKKLDHSTTAETFTLDSATLPTSVTRAT